MRPQEQINAPDIDTAARLDAARVLRDTTTPDLHALCEVDLHLHSFYSDGYHSPAGRVWEAWRRGMKAIALTDHDHFDGCLEAIEAGRIFGIHVVPGIEFYTDRPGIEIIAYWPLVDEFLTFLKNGSWREVVEPLRAAKKDQLNRMMTRIPDCMAGQGFVAEITPDDIRRYVRNGVSTKGDISVVMWQKYGPALKAKGLAEDVKDFQARYTTRDDQLNLPLTLEMDLSPEAFVRRVRHWGGLPGISHPTELRKKEGLGNADLRAVLNQLGNVGLQSLEVDGWRNSICPESGQYQTDLFLAMIDEYNQTHPLPLLPTNGSDDHNQPGEGLVMGCGRENNLRPEWGQYCVVEALEDRARVLSGKRPA